MRPEPWYRVVITDKPAQDGGTFWIWRIINSRGEIVAQGVRQYSTERRAREASFKILTNVTWRLAP